MKYLERILAIVGTAEFIIYTVVIGVSLFGLITLMSLVYGWVKK